MADLAQLIGSLPPDQREALKRQLVGKFQTAEPPSWKPPQWVPEMAVGMLPGAGDAMSAMDSVSAGQRMADAWRAGDYGGAAGAGLEALGHGLGVLPFFPSMVKAYHGSPHRFDQFSLDKIGTGEGAQAYGHGLYFAENPQIAGHYAKMENRQVTTDINARLKELAREMDKHAIPGQYRKFRDPRGEELAAEYDRLMHEKLNQKGALYNVSLDVEPEDLLDWDAPLSQQSEKVRKALEDVGHVLGAPPAGAWEAGTFSPAHHFYGPDGKIAAIVRREQDGTFTANATWLDEPARTFKSIEEAKQWAEQPLRNMTGEQIYRHLKTSKGGAEAASRALADAGIPGLRYFDAGSRGKSDGTRNVVMFRDDLIKIEGVE